MKKRLALLSLILAATSYASDEFYEEKEGENTVRLEESVISATGLESTVRNTTKNITIISNSDLEDKNYSEVSEMLKTVPGVTINNNVFGSFVDLRGQGVDKAKSNVQILVDGVNINPLDPAHGVLPLDTVPVESIERIEVIPGGGSVLYGNGTVGGVVNIITKTEAGKIYNVVGARYGSYGSKEFNVATGQKLGDDLTLQLAYNNKSTNGYREGSESDKEYFEGAINYKLNENNNITLKYSRGEEDKYHPNSLEKSEVEEDRRQDGSVDGEPWSESDKTELTRDAFTVNYKSKLTERLTFNLDASYQETENVWKSVMETWTMPWKPAIAQQSDGTFTDKKLQVSPKLNYQYGQKSDITLGLDYRDNTASRVGEPGYLGRYSIYEYDFEKETMGAYLLNTSRVGRLEFTQGYRREKSKYKLDRYSESYSAAWPAPLPPAGRLPGIPGMPYKHEVQTFKNSSDMTNDAYELGANYLYSDTGNAYVRFEGGFRTPAPTELVDKKEKTGEYVFNDLKEETYKTLEVGTKDFIGNSYVSMTLFYTETTNEILQTGDMPNDWAFYNLGKTERKGMELFAEQYLGKLTLSQSFTYIDATIKEGREGNDTTGNYIPGVSKYTANIGATYDFTSRLSSTVNVVYRDGYHVDEENTTEKVNEYITTDLTVNYTMENGLKLYAGINNLFNEMYYNSVSTGGTPDTNSDGLLYDPAAERNYYGGFKYSW